MIVSLSFMILILEIPTNHPHYATLIVILQQMTPRMDQSKLNKNVPRPTLIVFMEISTGFLNVVKIYMLNSIMIR